MCDGGGGDGGGGGGSTRPAFYVRMFDASLVLNRIGFSHLSVCRTTLLLGRGLRDLGCICAVFSLFSSVFFFFLF